MDEPDIKRWLRGTTLTDHPGDSYLLGEHFEHTAHPTCPVETCVQECACKGVKMLPLLNVVCDNAGGEADVSAAAVLSDLGWVPVLLDEEHIFGLQHPVVSEVKVPVMRVLRSGLAQQPLFEKNMAGKALEAQLHHFGFRERRRYKRVVDLLGTGWHGWPATRVPCPLALQFLETSFDPERCDVKRSALATLALLRWGNNPGHHSNGYSSYHFFSLSPFAVNVHVNGTGVSTPGYLPGGAADVVLAADQLMFCDAVDGVVSDDVIQLLELIAYHPDPRVQVFAAEHPLCPVRLRTMLSLAHHHR